MANRASYRSRIGIPVLRGISNGKRRRHQASTAQSDFNDPTLVIQQNDPASEDVWHTNCSFGIWRF